MAPDSALADQIRRYRAECARNPESLAFARLADAYRKAGEPERALELLERGLRRHPRYLSGHVVRARTLLDLGRGEEGLEAFGRVLELDPRNLVALRGTGRLARELGRLEQATAAYRRLRDLDPLDDEVGERLAEVEREAAAAAAAGAGPESSRDGERETEEDRGEGDIVVTVTMGELFLRQGLHAQAVRVFERLLARRPGDPLLTEKLETARRLAAGEGGGARPERTAPAGAVGRGTIREYLEGVLEGRAEVRPGPAASGFERWLREARGAEVEPDGAGGSRREAAEGGDRADRGAERAEP